MSFGNISLVKRTFLFFLILLPLSVPILLKPGEQLYSDHLGKFALGHSVLENGFRSGNLVLPSKEMDPEAKYCPTECIRIGEEWISPFPVALGYVYALVLPWAGIDGVYWAVAILVSLSLLLLGILWKWDPYYLGTLVLASPFMINGYFFPDVGIAAFLYIFGSFLLLSDSSKSSLGISLFAGFVSALAGWFRIEALVFPGLFWFLLMVKNLRSLEERRRILGYGFGILIGAGILLGIQYLLYGHPMGPRFAFNQPGVFLAPWKKWEIYSGLLFANPNRLGFFGYSPFFLVLFLFGSYRIFFRTDFLGGKEEASVRDLFCFSGMLAFAALVITAPNDGIIDFGSRYLHLSLPAFAGVFLLFLDSIPEKRKKFVQLGSIAILLFSVYITFSYTQILSKYGRKTTKLNRIYLEQKPDLVVVQIRTYSQILGKYFFQTPAVWLMKEPDVRDFFSRNSPDKFDKILFVETKAAILQSISDSDPFSKNEYYKSIVNALGPEFERTYVDNREDVLIFSMERKRIPE